MSNPELCRDWRSTEGLRSETTSWHRAEQGRVVAGREPDLDEFERRDPLGLRRWLSSGAGLGLDPTPDIHE